MKNFKKIVGTILVLGVAVLSSQAVMAFAENNNQKTNVCHVTGSQNNPWNAININTSALPTHLGHGDFLYTGPLKQNGTPSNDGNNWCKDHAPAQISAEKIICDSEADLPNWGAGHADITAATAPDFLASHPNCHEQHGWKYQYAPYSASNPGNNIEAAGAPWITFDENDLPEIQAGQKIWVREQLPTGYIPYSGATSNLGSTEAKNSAEFYCNTDVLNYDNYDSITGVQAGKLYHCVAFNVKVDVCPNIEGPQATVPEGMHLNSDHQCVPDTATIHATKVVCDNEFDLPNWGSGGPDITATTATDFVAGNSSCKIVPWTFQWAPNGTANPGDNVESAGAPWTSFSNGTIDVPAGTLVWLREQIPDTYQPFSGATTDLEGTNAKRSAEFYCNQDVLNYDNYDNITPVTANTNYYCVGFNTLKPTKADGKVHVYKYIDGQQATVDTAKDEEHPQGVSFPMFNAPYTQYPYYLGPYSDASAGDIPYESSTYNIVGGQTYTTQENLDTPLVGSSCSNENHPQYELVGYTTGKTLDEAKNGEPSKTVPEFIIDGDSYVIVWNHKCGPQVIDMCPNIPEVQATVPEGYHLNNDGQCVPDQNQCGDHTVDIVSDATNNVSGGVAGPATPIASPNPGWTNIPLVSWIWDGLTDFNGSTLQTRSFTKTFNIVGTPTSATLEVAADNSFVGNINGQGSGVIVDPTEFNYGATKTYNNVLQYLVAGVNTIGFDVSNFPVADSTFDNNPAGLTYKLHVTSNDCPICDSKVDLALNGSLENGVDAGTFATLNAGDTTSITNWTVDSGSVDYIGSYWQSSNGSRNIDLNGTTTGSISQTIPTTIGNTYTVTFDMSGNPDSSEDSNYTSPSAKVVRVSATGATFTDYTFDTALEGNTKEDMKWEAKSYTFVATSTNTVITFTSQIAGAFGPAVDNIKVVCGKIDVPNPAHITIIKNTVGGDGTFHFTGLGGETGFDLTTVEGTDSKTFDPIVDENTHYTITENVPEGWNLTGATCLYGDNSVGQAVQNGKEIVVDPGDHVTCTFTNTKIPVIDTCPASYVDNSDNSGAIRFETSQGYSNGSISGQNGWSDTVNPTYDQAVVNNTYGYPSFDDKTFRMSDAVTSGSFGDWVFAPSNSNGAGEADSTAGGFSKGTLQNHFEAQFDIASTVPCAQQEGLHISVSPDRGDGSRMSYLRFEDGASGLDVFFYDVQGTGNPANFVQTQVASGLSRSIPHKVKFVMDFVNGPSNDVVKIYIDGNLVHTGTSWENYYRYDSEANAEQSPRIVKTLIFQARGTATPANLGKGYLFDNLTLGSSVPAPLCSDGIDNDADQLIDANDPGCHSDGNANNSESYVASDNDESNGGGGGGGPTGPTFSGGGGHPTTPSIGKVLGESTSCGLYLDDFLKMGKKNDKGEVKKLQQFLNDYLKLKPKLPVNGIFGLQTYKAVVKFQEQESDFVLKPWVGITLKDSKKGTGWVFKSTVTHINNIMCPELNIPLPPLTLTP